MPIIPQGKKIKKSSLVEREPINWRCAIFTMASIAIFAAEVLNFCVRDGNRCDHFAIITRSSVIRSKPNTRYFV